MSFFAEIRRRKVFQVAAVYAVVAWLIMQVVDVIGEPLSLPEWLDTVVIVLLAVGFPIAIVLAWAIDLTPERPAQTQSPQSAGVTYQIPGQRFGFVLQGLVLVAVAFLVLDQFLSDVQIAGTTDRSSSNSSQATLAQGVRRLNVILGEVDVLSNTGLRAHVAISPNGKLIAYAAARNGASQLYLRSLDQLEAQPLPGTEGAHHPFFSPDSEWVAYYSDTGDHKLKKVSINGGPSIPLADAPVAPGGTWGANDLIVFSTADSAGGVGSGGRTLFAMSANGGTPRALLPSSDGWNQWPHMLPNGKVVVFTIRPPGGDASNGRIAALSLETGEQTVLLEGAYNARFAPTGHLMFIRGGALWAVPFDIDRLELVGPQVPIVRGVMADSGIGGAAYAFADDGTLVYMPGGEVGGVSRLIWVDGNGREYATPLASGTFVSPAISPDGGQVVYNNDGYGIGDIWVSDLSRGTSSRLTFDGDATTAIWTRDGQRIVFGTSDGIYWKPSNGTGQAELLVALEAPTIPTYISPDNQRIVYVRNVSSADIFLADIGDRSRSVPLVSSEFRDDYPDVSPDGKWIAYQSNETGPDQIFVRPFPNVDQGKWQVSIGGGVKPIWGPDGRQLYFRGGGSDDAVMVVDVSTNPTFSAETPRVFASGYNNLGGGNYDISPDGQRILLRTDSTEGDTPDSYDLVVVENWFEELRRLAPLPE